jgi:hypothetical protein
MVVAVLRVLLGLRRIPISPRVCQACKRRMDSIGRKQWQAFIEEHRIVCRCNTFVPPLGEAVQL